MIIEVEKLVKETYVGFYGRATYNTALKDISLYDWINLYTRMNKDKVLKIRQMNDIDADKAKKMKLDLLPCICVTGHFGEYRRIRLADRMNAVLCIDIDKGDNKDIEDFEKVKRDIMTLPYVFYASLSCRGEGVFCYVCWDTSKDFLKVWYALERDFKEKFNIVIDKNCKDITRLRFISYDSNTLYKKYVDVYSDEYEKYVQDDTFDENHRLNEDDNFTFLAIFHLIDKCGYKADSYNDWLQDGFRLATFGDDGKRLFMYLSQVSDKYDKETALKKWDECVRTTTKKKSCLAYYFARLREYYGSDWRKNIE